MVEAQEFCTAAALIYGQQLSAVSVDIMQSSADVSTTASRPRGSCTPPPLMHGSHLHRDFDISGKRVRLCVLKVFRHYHAFGGDSGSGGRKWICSVICWFFTPPPCFEELRCGSHRILTSHLSVEYEYQNIKWTCSLMITCDFQEVVWILQ